MSIPLDSFSNEQKFWYANLVIAAVLADKEIDVSETEFLKQVLTVVQSPNQKKRLMNYVANKEQPPLSAPTGLSKEVLAAIYVELILIMISDLDLAENEKSFLEKIGSLFKFDPKYIRKVFKWGEKGLEWKQAKSQIIGTHIPDHVPLKTLTSEQKQWYAETLISSIMSDGQIDREEVAFVKMASAMIDSKSERQKLMGYMKNKMCPPLLPPPKMPKEVVYQIFIEVLMIVSADETVSYKEKLHLQELSDLCGLTPEQFEKMMDWCNTGIKWKQSKNQLIAEVKLKSVTPSKGPKVNSQYNSLLERKVKCYICNSDTPFTSFYLKPNTHKPDRNVFGIITYADTFKGYDFIDFNHIKVSICPTCFFASPQKEYFKKVKTGVPPENLTNKKFVTHWLKNLKTRKLLFENNLTELNTIDPSLDTVAKMYKTAIEVSNLIHKTSQKDEQKWVEISLYLNLAEIYSETGHKEVAEDILMTAVQISEQLFKTAKSCLLSIKCARILLIAALYRKDYRSANDYMKFLSEEKSRNFSHYQPSELVFLSKVYKEAKHFIENKAELKKENLVGFHKDII